MAIPGKMTKPLAIYRGDSFTKRFLIGKRMSPDPASVAGVDATFYGNVWQGTLRAYQNAPVSTNFAVDLSEAQNGYVTIRLTAAQTTALPDKGVWDLQAIDTSTQPSTVRTLVRGNFEVTKDVTWSITA